MPICTRDICAALFSRPVGGAYTCETCGKACKSSNGFTNLIAHLKRYHPSYEMKATIAIRERNALQLRLVDERTLSIYRWCELVIMERLPFNFVERRLVRLNTRLSSVAVETLITYMDRLQGKVATKVAVMLPDTFGLVIDGWTCGSRYYVAIFAVFDDGSDTSASAGSNDYFDDLHCNSRRFLLLAFSPLDDEGDLSAQSVFDLIADTLSRFDKPWEAVAFMVGDNCSVNQYIGRRVGGIPHIGCASHRFQLAVREFLDGEATVINRVHALMLKLRTIKGRALLRRVTPLAPVLKNDTRWSSTCAMLRIYMEISVVIGQLGHDALVEYDIQPLLLRRAETETVRTNLVDLERFEAITKTLQSSTLTFSGVRRLFDHVLKSYPQMGTRLLSTEVVVNYPALETGIVKLQRQEALSSSERTAVAAFKGTDFGATAAPAETEESFVTSAFKRHKTTRRTQYMDVGFIPPTSNE